MARTGYGGRRLVLLGAEHHSTPNTKASPSSKFQFKRFLMPLFRCSGSVSLRDSSFREKTTWCSFKHVQRDEAGSMQFASFTSSQENFDGFHRNQVTKILAVYASRILVPLPYASTSPHSLESKNTPMSLFGVCCAASITEEIFEGFIQQNTHGSIFCHNEFLNRLVFQNRCLPGLRGLLAGWFFLRGAFLA